MSNMSSPDFGRSTSSTCSSQSQASSLASDARPHFFYSRDMLLALQPALATATTKCVAHAPAGPAGCGLEAPVSAAAMRASFFDTVTN